jgi:hypothetical protein
VDESGGRCDKYSVAVMLTVTDNAPEDSAYRIKHFYQRSQPLLTGRLFDLLREMSAGADENGEMQHYPCEVRVTDGFWIIRVTIHVMLIHDVPQDEVRERLDEEFMEPLKAVAVYTLLPLPPAINYPPGVDPKYAVAFMSRQFWAKAPAV